MEPQAFAPLIGFYWILLSLILFFLRNFRGYLKRKPPGFQTLLDGANVHLLEYLGLAVSIFDVIAVSIEIFNHQVNQILAETLAWILLLDQQLFYSRPAIVLLSIAALWTNKANDCAKVESWDIR